MNNSKFSYALHTFERGRLSDPKASRFYGDPYVPASLADKFDENFIFLAQLRLDMLKGWDSEELLPHEGYLYLFIDAEMYPSNDLYVFAEYTTEEPDTLLEGFNARSPIKEGLNEPYEIMPINMSGYAEDGGTRLFGLDMNYKDIGVLLQYSPRDFPGVPFLADLDGYMYIIFGEEGLSDARFVVEPDTDEDRKLMKKAENCCWTTE